MSRIKYYYNTENCQYEPIIHSRRAIALNILAFLSVALLLASGITYFYQQNFESFRESALLEQNNKLKVKWELLNNRLNNFGEVVNELTYHDDHIYRVILDSEPIPSTVREGGIGGHERYQNIINAGLDSESLILDTYQSIDRLKKKLYIQTKSYDELNEILKEKERMWASRPAIQPINNAELIRISSGFNPHRFHPILKRVHPHKGIDFTASTGTPVYATGDGIVTNAYYSSSYGNVIFINHSYGYETRYAHLNAFNIKVGQHVKRGEIIGYVGNTGRSQAPHLHYEVLHNNLHIDPINYFQRDLSHEEYEKLIELSEGSENIILD